MQAECKSYGILQVQCLKYSGIRVVKAFVAEKNANYVLEMTLKIMLFPVKHTKITLVPILSELAAICACCSSCSRWFINLSR